MAISADRWVALIAAVAAGFLVCCGLQQQARPPAPPRATEVVKTTDSDRDPVEAVVKIAREKLATKIPPERMPALEDELRFSLRAQLTPAFDRYAEHMKAKGLELNREAMAGTIDLRLPGATGEPDSLFAAYWGDARARSMAWDSMDVGGVTSGTGLVADGGRDWPEHAYIAQMSFFLPPGGALQEREGEKIKRSNRGAWVQIPAVISGETTHVRLVFLYEEGLKTWRPFVVIVGTHDNFEPVPMM